VLEDQTVPLSLVITDNADLQNCDTRGEDELITSTLTVDIGCLNTNHTVSIYVLFNCSMISLRGSLLDVNNAIRFMTYTPKLDWSGETEINVVVIGSDSPEETISVNISVFVTAVNDLPQFYSDSRLLKSITGGVGSNLLTLNSEEYPTVLGVKTIAGRCSAIFLNISVSDSDSLYLSGVVTVSRGTLGVGGGGGEGLNDGERGSSIAINATAQELSASLQALEFTSPMETFLTSVSCCYCHF
jgi:hypothetical protein